MTDDRYSTDTRDRVFDAICELAEEFSTPPSQQQIADYLDISQQTVSNVFRELALLGRIEWLTRYTYRVHRATWEPPEDPSF